MGADKDTLRLTLSQAEQRFRENNALLLAGKFSIEASKAVITQAKLWSNPNLALEQNIYNPQTGRVFDVTNQGNTEVALTQLILLAGKRSKQISLAESNVRLSEENYYNTIRVLKHSLRSDFYALYYQQKALAFYEATLPNLRTTVSSAEAMFQKRTLLLSEVLRLKALLFQLENERTGIVTTIADTQAEINLLLRDITGRQYVVVPLFDREPFALALSDSLSINSLYKQAVINRPDVRLAEAQISVDEKNYDLQQALAVPDITVGFRYSRAGSYIQDYTALSAAIDLPFFNRNQGNIEVARLTIEQDKFLLEQTRSTARREITLALQRAKELDRNIQKIDNTFTNEFTTLLDGMNTNLRNKNISIIEFTDFYESYRTSMLQMNQFRSDRAVAIESINYTVGQDIVLP